MYKSKSSHVINNKMTQLPRNDVKFKKICNDPLFIYLDIVWWEFDIKSGGVIKSIFLSKLFGQIGIRAS